jgi:hypothetical protein
MAENAVVGLWDFLLGHAPDNGRTDCHKQEQPTMSSIAGPSMGAEVAAMVAYALIVHGVFEKCCFVTIKLSKSK